MPGSYSAGSTTTPETAWANSVQWYLRKFEKGQIRSSEANPHKWDPGAELLVGLEVKLLTAKRSIRVEPQKLCSKFAHLIANIASSFAHVF